MIFRKPKKKERTVPMKVPNNSFFLVDKLRVRKNKVVTEYKGKQTSNMFFYAYRLPTTLPFGWLPLVLDSVDECYEILLDFNPLDVNETIQAQDARIRNLSIDIKAIELSGKTPPQSMVESLNEARSVHRAIVMGEEKPFNIFPYGRIYQERERGESNPEKVKKFLGVLTGAINGFGFYTKKATSKTLRRIARKSFILPSLDILDDRLALSSYVVNMFPFGCSTLPSDINLDGIFVGPVLPSGQPCIIDIEETGEGKNFNNNITIIGCPGAGKSVFVGTLACRANDRGIGVLIIDCQAEYLDVVSSRGGVVLTFGYQRDAQEHVFINLLDPFDIPLPERIRQLLMLLSRIFELTQPQESFLREAIKEVYERKGIFINDPESWEKKSPTMSDLLQVINRRREEAAEEKDVVSKNILDSLYIRIRELTKDGAYPFFDGESTFQVEYLREKLVCINLKPLASEFARRLVGLAVLQIANSHLGKIKRHWRIAIDEGWIFLKTEEILREILKTGRKYNCGLWIATQDLEDIGGSAATLLADSATKILLRTDETAIDQVARKFKLPSYLAELATKLKVGEALIKLSSLPTWLRVYVEPEIIPKARFEETDAEQRLKTQKPVNYQKFAEEIENKGIVAIKDVGLEKREAIDLVREDGTLEFVTTAKVAGGYESYIAKTRDVEKEKVVRNVKHRAIVEEISKYLFEQGIRHFVSDEEEEAAGLPDIRCEIELPSGEPLKIAIEVETGTHRVSKIADKVRRHSEFFDIVYILVDKRQKASYRRALSDSDARCVINRADLMREIAKLKSLKEVRRG